MEQIIRQLLIESGYSENSGSIKYFQKKNAAFFFTISITDRELQAIKNKDLFEENESYKSLLTEFNKIIREGHEVAIEKNSSLIILVECANIDAIFSLQQQILLLEEDEFFFKKYVLLYTLDSIENLETLSPIIPEVTTKLHNDSQFEIFAQNGATSEILEYLVILQLFIKLPFLKLDFENQDFKTLDQKIFETLNNDNDLFMTLVEKVEEIEKLDFTKPDSEDAIDNFISSLPHD